MIIVKLQGGLGNQMFQYALGRNIAYTNNVEFKLDISGFKKSEGITPRVYELKYFNIIENFASEKDLIQFRSKNRIIRFIRNIINKFRPYYRHSTIRERYFHFDLNILKSIKNIYLDGYWQSEKYFKDIESILHKEFTIKYPQEGKNKELAEMIKKTDSISIHVRRGDYISDYKTNQFHGVCNLDYYNICINEISKKIKDPTFFIFSDEPEWVLKNFKIPYPFIIINHNGLKYSYEDLRLMSQCKHHIIANSTFSWWGAWLNENPNKIVLAPRKWFNFGKFNSRDVIPDGWMSI